MAILVNDSNISERADIYFNGSPVQKVFENGVLVWQKRTNPVGDYVGGFWYGMSKTFVYDFPKGAKNPLPETIKFKLKCRWHADENRWANWFSAPSTNIGDHWYEFNLKTNQTVTCGRQFTLFGSESPRITKRGSFRISFDKYTMSVTLMGVDVFYLYWDY